MTSPGQWWIDSVGERLVCGPGWDFSALVAVSNGSLEVCSAADPDNPVCIPLDLLQSFVQFSRSDETPTESDKVSKQATYLALTILKARHAPIKDEAARVADTILNAMKKASERIMAGEHESLGEDLDLFEIKGDSLGTATASPDYFAKYEPSRILLLEIGERFGITHGFMDCIAVRRVGSAHYAVLRWTRFLARLSK